MKVPPATSSAQRRSYSSNGAVEPVDPGGLAEVRHLFHPADEVLVGGGRNGGSDGLRGLLGGHERLRSFYPSLRL